MGLFSLLGCSKKPDPDEAVLIQLKKAGSDLSKPHQIDFYLYFPTQTNAEQAGSQVRASGFTVVVRPAARGSDWLCLAKKTVIPELATLHKIGSDFEALTTSLGGTYDGWEAAVVK